MFTGGWVSLQVLCQPEVLQVVLVRCFSQVFVQLQKPGVLAEDEGTGVLLTTHWYEARNEGCLRDVQGNVKRS